MVKTRNLFISHSWAHAGHYENLVNLLGNANRFDYKNYSVPKDDPIHIAGGILLRAAIKKQIDRSQIVLIIAGIYSTNSSSIGMEIDIAQKACKPILAIRPWAAKRISDTADKNADNTVYWNTDSIVSAIRELVP